MITAWLLIHSVWAAEPHAAAATHEAAVHGAHVIPWFSLFVQTFNVGVIFVLLFFALRKAVTAHFHRRAKDYQELVERAAAAKKEAERGRREIQDRLNQLEAGAEQSLVRARSEAEELKTRMVLDAKTMAQKLEQEAQRRAKADVEKAKGELRRELLQKALDVSRNELKSGLGNQEQKKLQNEFVDKIQVVSG